ncbi:tyrosine-type recombinase/integrase [Deinococcus enclensis]|uniref:Integrase n=1 Tax=Deinococcus enclensis TaxID=1049582 RepID=A0ABT9MIW6_9DEIO|nr:site-specific integrase [Deinococcus enclensis]MDP9766512.1 integrase [Deinococcus enclensis]
MTTRPSPRQGSSEPQTRKNKRTRANNAGSVRELPSGTWQAAYSIPGTTRRKTFTCRTKREAEKKLNQILADLDRGLLAVPDNITLAEWMEQYFATKLPTLAASTAADYEWVRDKIILPALGHRPLQALKPLDIVGLYAQLALKYQRSVLVQVRAILRGALREALINELVMRNVVEGIPLPARKATPATEDPQEVGRALTPEEVTRYLGAAQTLRGRAHRWRRLFHLMLATGLRRGEICALRWENVDLDRGELKVRRAVGVGKGGKPEEGLPKTLKSRRTVTLDADMVALLRDHAEEQAIERAALKAWREHGMVFTTLRGTPIHPDDLSKVAREVARAAGVDVRLHDLRHTHASLLLSRGVPVEIVSERLGHADPAITLRIYRHVYHTEHLHHTYSLSDLLQGAPKVTTPSRPLN